MNPTTAIIALGSNLGDSHRIIETAFDRLQKFSAQPIRRSSLWRSSPVDCPHGSPDFLNAVAAITPRRDETPDSLLSKLQSLELEFGRKPKATMNEPRPLDLDLITFGTETRSTTQLTLPHPRACLRRFVLAPLNEIAPRLVIPAQTKTVAELLDLLATDELVERC